jgi:uncharacterized repeat protein (TIGR03803 family)
MAVCGAAAPAQAGTYQLLYSFSARPDGQGPWSGLVNVGGTLYGTTENGGIVDLGTVFALNPATGAETVV